MKQFKQHDNALPARAPPFLVRKLLKVRRHSPHQARCDLVRSGAGDGRQQEPTNATRMSGHGPPPMMECAKCLNFPKNWIPPVAFEPSAPWLTRARESRAASPSGFGRLLLAFHPPMYFQVYKRWNETGSDISVYVLLIEGDDAVTVDRRDRTGGRWAIRRDGR